MGDLRGRVEDLPLVSSVRVDGEDVGVIDRWIEPGEDDLTVDAGHFGLHRARGATGDRHHPDHQTKHPNDRKDAPKRAARTSGTFHVPSFGLLL